MAIPKSKYSDPRHTPGKEFTLNGQEYKGWYVETYQKRYYTGRTITERSQEIFPIVSQTLKVDLFAEQKIIPSTSDRLQGTLLRYLIQKISNRKIIEVTKERYDLLKNKAGYKGAIIEWIIKGPAENKLYNSYPYYGAEHRNRETVSKLENTLPGIINFFKDYSEFVE